MATVIAASHMAAASTSVTASLAATVRLMRGDRTGRDKDVQ
jgi:hypothetical protein